MATLMAATRLWLPRTTRTSPLLRSWLARPPVASAAARALCAATSPVAQASPTEAPSRFAVVSLGGTQYKVSPDDLICVEKLALPVGATLSARRVLLVGQRDATIIGSPLIEGASVQATVEEQGYAKKVIVFKKKRRKGYRRWKGHRSRLTMLRIESIELPAKLEAALAEAG